MLNYQDLKNSLRKYQNSQTKNTPLWVYGCISRYCVCPIVCWHCCYFFPLSSYFLCAQVFAYGILLTGTIIWTYLFWFFHIGNGILYQVLFLAGLFSSGCSLNTTCEMLIWVGVKLDFDNYTILRQLGSQNCKNWSKV